MATAKEIAEWMVGRVEKDDLLYQEVVVYEIEKRFGSDFVYVNRNGNLAIARKVLSEFRKLTNDDVVWERGERLWRKRAAYDPKGRSAE